MILLPDIGTDGTGYLDVWYIWHLDADRLSNGPFETKDKARDVQQMIHLPRKTKLVRARVIVVVKP